MAYRYFIKISFDGTRYNGWQVQKNSAHTVQQKINEGLSKLLSEDIVVLGCCRTDAGVHAKELYAQFDSEKNDLHVSPKGVVSGEVDWLHKFNSMLPTDISIDGIYSVVEDTNARFDATARTYNYFIHDRRNPFLVNRSYYYYSDLDISLMNKAGKILMKNEDFSSFSKVNTQVKTNNCRISKAEWKKDENGLVFTIRADRFLRGMVRMIVGTMLLIGKHKITLKDLEKILDSKDCRNAGRSVPACGLYLVKVEYPTKIFKV
jgi:tRNA pseudouridine38-40 synthase